jgi:signal peptidase II
MRTLVILAILSANVGCDQISKNIVRENIRYGQKITLVPDFLTLTKVENTGAFLSMGNSMSQPWKTILLAIFPILILGLGIMYLFLKKGLSNLSVLGICLLLGGGIGNIYDRIIYGSVTDFLHADLIIFQTGIFNIADMSIMTGIGLIIFEMVLKRKRLPA